MVNRMQFYIDGAWVDPVVKKSTPVVNPATAEAMYEVALGSKADVDKGVAAARRAFESYSQTSREERVAQGAPYDRTAPFGGYKQSGNGREWGKYGLEEYLEVKAIAGINAA